MRLTTQEPYIDSVAYVIRPYNDRCAFQMRIDSMAQIVL